MDAFEQWTRSEIDRLRAMAQTSLTEADALQRALDKWLEAQGIQARPEPMPPGKHGHNGAKPHVRGKRASYGNKNAAALEMIKEASPAGLTTDELFDRFAELFGPKYKRSSLRSLLWNQRKLDKIENRDGRYVIIPERPNA